MARLFRKAMDYLYYACVLVGCTAMVLISAVIPWAVFTRYVLNSAASGPKQPQVLLTIVLTFIGAAAGYRFHVHMNLSFFVNLLPASLAHAGGRNRSIADGRYRLVHGHMGYASRRGHVA